MHGSNVRGVRGEMAGHDHLSRNYLGEGGMESLVG